MKREIKSIQPISIRDQIERIIEYFKKLYSLHNELSIAPYDSSASGIVVYVTESGHMRSCH